jgi:hypothetical protein
MSEKQTVSFEQGLSMLEVEQKLNLKPPQENPKVIPLKHIRTAHSVFQPRQFEDGLMASSEEHVRGLLEAIYNEASHILDPVSVWWSGKSWYVIDGHHRLLAYSRYEAEGKHPPVRVPVVNFRGSVYEAIAESIRLNSKDKLPMSKSDKSNRAWKLVVLEKTSKQTIARICGIGTSTVGRMRNLLTQYKIDYPTNHQTIALSKTWEDAYKSSLGERVIDDNWIRKQAQEWAKRLGKAFGKKASTQPDIFAMAIEIYSEKLKEELMEVWRYDLEDFAEDGLKPDF